MIKTIQKIKEYGWRRSFDIFYKYRLEPVAGVVFKILFQPLKLKNVIILSSHNDYDMNAGALYEYMLEHEMNQKYKIVWFVRERTNKKLPYNVFEEEIRHIGIKKFYWHAVAKYIFYEDAIIRKWKKDQMVVLLCHGTRALKNCKGLLAQPSNINYICSASEYNDEFQSEIYEVELNKFLHVGFPVTDILYKRSNEIEKLGMKNNYKKVIIWMPTFRKSAYVAKRIDTVEQTETGLPLIDTYKCYQQFDAFLKQKDVLIILKLHPIQDPKDITVSSTDNICILSAGDVKVKNIDTYKLLTQTDALISDYSSITFEYMILDRPIAYVLSDREAYSRGLDWSEVQKLMPGDYVYTLDDMKKFIDSVMDGADKHKVEREHLCGEINKYNDGSCCQKIVEYFRM